jgi:hypothetical protein
MFGFLVPNTSCLIRETPCCHDLNGLGQHRPCCPHEEAAIWRRQISDRQCLYIIEGHASVMSLRGFFKASIAPRRESPRVVRHDQSIGTALQRSKRPIGLSLGQIIEKRDLVKHDSAWPENRCLRNWRKNIDENRANVLWKSLGLRISVMQHGGFLPAAFAGSPSLPP